MSVKKRGKRIKPLPAPGLREKFTLVAGWQELAGLFHIRVEQLLAESKLAPELAKEEHLRINTAELMRLWAAMERLAGDRDIVEMMLLAFDAMLPAPYLAALCSRDLRSGLIRFTECKRPMGPLRVRIEENETEARVYFDWAVPFRELCPRFLLAEFAFILALAERGLGRKPEPLRAACPVADQIDPALAVKHLGIPVVHAPEMLLALPVTDLDCALQGNNPSVLKILEDRFKEIDQSHPAGLMEQVRSAIVTTLPQGSPSIAKVAEQIGCSPRTLQRELAMEGITFRAVLQETRRDLACHYLTQKRYSPKEVCFLLGYSEPATFHRAFRGWTGKRPGDSLSMS